MITREDSRTLREARERMVARLELFSRRQRRRLTIPMVNQLLQCADDEACRLLLDVRPYRSRKRRVTGRMKSETIFAGHVGLF